MIKECPCFMTIYNSYTWADKMLADLKRMRFTPVLLDNGSDFGPCVDWLKKVSTHGQATVISLNGNRGPHAYYSIPFALRSSWYAVCDSDLDLSDVPSDAIDKLESSFLAFPEIAKSALSLEIEDIPEESIWKKQVIDMETQYWNKENYVPEHDCFRTMTDSTFFLTHADRNNILNANFYSSVRLNKPYTARHIPWYADSSTWGPEDFLYMLRQRLTGVVWSARFQNRVNKDAGDE